MFVTAYIIGGSLVAYQIGYVVDRCPRRQFQTLISQIMQLNYNLKSIYSRKTEPLGDIRRSSCGELDVGNLCSSVVRAVDRQSKDLGSNPSAVETVFFSTERFSNSLKFLELFFSVYNK